MVSLLNWMMQLRNLKEKHRRSLDVDCKGYKCQGTRMDNFKEVSEVDS